MSIFINKCPRCGTREVTIKTEKIRWQNIYCQVQCKNCGLSTSWFNTQNQRELMTEWNRFAGALGKFQTVKV